LALEALRRPEADAPSAGGPWSVDILIDGVWGDRDIVTLRKEAPPLFCREAVPVKCLG